MIKTMNTKYYCKLTDVTYNILLIILKDIFNSCFSTIGPNHSLCLTVSFCACPAGMDMVYITIYGLVTLGNVGKVANACLKYILTVCLSYP